MLNTMIWLLRATAVIAIGIDTFAFAKTRGPLAGAATAAAFAICCVAMILWIRIEARGGLAARRDRVLPQPLALAVMAVAAGAVCTQRDSAGMIGIALIAVITAGTETSLAASWCVAGVAVVAVEAGALVGAASTGAVLGYPLLVLIALLTGHQRRSYRIQAEQSALMLRQVEQLRAEQRQVAVLDERTRIAREIHDVLAHSLGALGIQIQAARALLEDDAGADRADEVLAVAQRFAAEGLAETRRAVNALRTDPAPLDEQLATMAQSHRQLHKSTVTVRVCGAPVPLPSDQALALTRTAQESLTNAAKHAPYQDVEIVLQYEEDAVALTVANLLALGGDGPGRGADGVDTGGSGFATVNGGYGLTGMRERLLLLNGALSAGVEDGRWTVAARVPR